MSAAVYLLAVVVSGISGGAVSPPLYSTIAKRIGEQTVMQEGGGGKVEEGKRKGLEMGSGLERGEGLFTGHQLFRAECASHGPYTPGCARIRLS